MSIQQMLLATSAGKTCYCGTYLIVAGGGGASGG